MIPLQISRGRVLPPIFIFDNSYARLPSRFYARQSPAPVAGPRLVKLNQALAFELGLDHNRLRSAEGVARGRASDILRNLSRSEGRRFSARAAGAGVFLTGGVILASVVDRWICPRLIITCQVPKDS